MKELSILIPTYNDKCYQLVSDLHQQAMSLGIVYEIVVADDGSTDKDVLAFNRAIKTLPNCRLIERSLNSGRAAIRNFLTQQAQYSWLLFIDSDMTVCRQDFLKRYVSVEGEVLYGGVVIGKVTKNNLRSLYEQSKEHEHTFEKRQQSPYQDFHTANFLIRRELMLRYPFDERFKHYGYEDVLLGKTLRRHRVAIRHIDNPLGFCAFETNADFVAKTEEGLRTLYQFREDLRGYSRLLTLVSGIHIPLVVKLIRALYRLFGPAVRRNLCSTRPKLFLFKLYKLGYYLCQASR
jgi:glycosyltransferase involved in cell wall biosynthesis